MNCIDDAIKVWRTVIKKITGLSNDLLLNGESIRGPELVRIKNGKKVPISQEDTVIIHYCDPIDDISMVDSSNPSTAQSYELHLIVYGNKCKKISQTIKSNLYTEGILDILRESGIGLLDIPTIQNTSNFIVEQTYILRSDIRIRFNCILEDEKIMKDIPIENVDESFKII